ncbi:MAG: hypothetical protein JOZ22_24435, partial [Acidobacteriia bacterium]|nr:hypothetical protein [Terriglobia bacterium]
SPVLGFLPGSGPADLYAILGTARKPELGLQIPAPSETIKIYLPPRQQYVLLESASDQPMAISNPYTAFLANSQLESAPIPGTMSHPDRIAFSPRGEAACLLSFASGRLQVIANLPGHPTLLRELSIASWNESPQFALTDDGELIVAALSGARLMRSIEGGAWQSWSVPYTPGAWTFVSNSHDLLIADPSQGSIALVSKLGEMPEIHILATQGVQANLLVVTKDGRQCLAADSLTGKLLSLDLRTGTLTSLAPANIEHFLSLRDGRTFLLSAYPALSLLRLTPPAQLTY